MVVQCNPWSRPSPRSCARYMQLHIIFVRSLFFLSYINVLTTVVAATSQSSTIHRLRALVFPTGGWCPPKPNSLVTAKLKAATINFNLGNVASQQSRRLFFSQHLSYYGYGYSTSVRANCPAAVFITFASVRDKNQRHQNIHEPTLHLDKRKRGAFTTMVENIDNNDVIVARNISSILLNSVQSIDSTTNEALDITKSIQDATQLLHNLQSRANSLCVKESAFINNVGPSRNENSNNRQIAPLQLLSDKAISTVEALRLLVHYVNQSPQKGKRSRKGSKQSSGRAWSALESVVTASLGFDSLTVLDSNGSNSELSITLAVLALGLALAINSTVHPAITKMIASAVLPSDEVHRGKNYQKLVGSMTGPARIPVHVMARSAILGLLRLSVDTSVRCSDNKTGTVDMQIVAKLESGFCVGSVGRSLNDGKCDAELSKAAADVVDSVLKIGMDADVKCSIGDGESIIISKDIFAPMLSIIANLRPWSYVDVEKLARIAAEMDLWYSAEILMDAVIDTGELLDQNPTMTKCGEAISLTPASAHDSTAQRTAQTIVDIAFDHRLYRRADVLATKYYSYVGPERYAEARFLHACDTIEKVIKKRQVQIIEKQVERVDEVIMKVNRDVALADNLKTTRFQGEDIAIETMSDHIREFSLRRLRASNMHTTAARLAKLWGVSYCDDPIKLMQELEKRKLMYLQWNDDCCPGGSCRNYKTGSLPLPELISTPSDLLGQFAILQNETGAIGFDCEWHDSINHVALLQLSTTTNSLLLDIPALTMTKEGCDALRYTVGTLFTRSYGRPVVGFSCKDDIKRLRASPCVPSSTHWFPLKDHELNVRDLRHMVAEISPSLGDGRGLMNFGLSRMCEIFLGKQLDKAEQCSDWLIRPLSPEQIEYAALDAWACAAIHSKIVQRMAVDSAPQLSLSECKSEM